MEGELGGKCPGAGFPTESRGLSQVGSARGTGRAEPAEGVSVCDTVLASQVQWSGGQTSSDTFWGARMLLELSGGSLD